MSTEPATGAPWSGAAAPTAEVGELPDVAEVVVLGGDLAGLCCAFMLAEQGVEVVLVAPTIGAAHHDAASDPGFVAAGYLEPPERLVHSVGAERCRGLLAFTEANLELLESLGLLDRSGGLHPALGEREAGTVDAALAVNRDAGQVVERWEPGQVAARLGAEGFGPARFLPREGQVQPVEALRALEQRCRAAGVTMLPGHAPETFLEGRRGFAVKLLGGHVIHADAIVLTDGLSHQELLPWLGDKLMAVRAQALATEAGAVPPELLPWDTQMGWIGGRATPEGHLVVSGCRWATMHMEVGDTDTTVVRTAIDAKLRAFLAGRWPHLAQAPLPHRWTWLQDHSCDGLPIVGPMPGRAALLTCVGFTDRPWSLAPACAQALVSGLIGGQPVGLPDMFRSDRFL